MPHPSFDRRPFLKLGAAASVLPWLSTGTNAAPARGEARADAAGPFEIYRPAVQTGDIFFPHPAIQPRLRYNHCVDVVSFKGKYFAAWNANERTEEGAGGQYVWLATTPDFVNWGKPVRPFGTEAGATNPIDEDNQWQPGFINLRDEILFCAWCAFRGRKTVVSHTTDGVRWTNVEVPNAPDFLKNTVVGFPTTHGLLTSRGVIMFPCSFPPVSRKVGSQASAFEANLAAIYPAETQYSGRPAQKLNVVDHTQRRGVCRNVALSGAPVVRSG